MIEPARIREILAHYETHGWAVTIRTYPEHRSALATWLKKRTERGPDWPTWEEQQQWTQMRSHRQTRSAINARSTKRRIIRNGAPALVDSLGTVRRIQALHRLGWTQAEIAARLGCSPRVISHRITLRKFVTPATHNAVAAVYEELCMKLGPSNITRARAEAAGWAPPLAYDDIDNPDEQPKGFRPSTVTRRGVDMVAVERAIAGDLPPRRLTPTEREAVALRLHAAGMTDGQVGERLGVDPRTAFRIRQRLGLPANNPRAAVLPKKRGKSGAA